MSQSGCIIWMHGLGADASDMQGLADSPPLSSLPFKHMCLNAPVRPVTLNGGMPMRAWYDIIGLTAGDRVDAAGIKTSQTMINQAIASQIDAGFAANKIILAGFSQGGAMALYTAVHSTIPIGGVIALSAYLPLPEEMHTTLPADTPVFLGYGQFDPIVKPEWTQASKEWLTTLGYNQITLRQYPMEHSICYEEVNDIARWLTALN